MKRMLWPTELSRRLSWSKSREILKKKESFFCPVFIFLKNGHVHVFQKKTELSRNRTCIKSLEDSCRIHWTISSEEHTLFIAFHRTFLKNFDSKRNFSFALLFLKKTKNFRKLYPLPFFLSKEGFEPPTLWFVATCSSPLSYMPFFIFFLVFFHIRVFRVQ
jgi:hypothetical protein